jgi:hypothetical protein
MATPNERKTPIESIGFTDPSINDLSKQGEFDDIGELESAPEQPSESRDASAPVVPEKFKDKGLPDVIKSYQELERKYGEQANEVGELRRYVRQVVEMGMNNQTDVKPEPEIDHDTFMENPREAVKRSVKPELDKVTKELQDLKYQARVKEFYTTHPDAREVGQSDEFKSWINQNQTRVRKALAADNGDVDAADDLLSTWKEIQSVRKSATARTEEADNARLEADMAAKEAKASAARKDTLRRMSGETGRSASSSKKLYRSADIIRLKIENPDRYDALADEILLAYKEGRVK